MNTSVDGDQVVSVNDVNTTQWGASGRVVTYISEEHMQSVSIITLDPEISLLPERLNNITINSCSYQDFTMCDYTAVNLPPFGKGENDKGLWS